PDLSSSDEEGPSTFTVFTEVHRDPLPLRRLPRMFPLLAGMRRSLSLSSLSSESSDVEGRWHFFLAVTTYSSEDEGSSVVPVGRNPRIQSNHGATPVAGKPNEELQADGVPEEKIVPCCVHLHLEEVPRTSSPPPGPSRGKRPSRLTRSDRAPLRRSTRLLASAKGTALPSLPKGFAPLKNSPTYNTWKQFDTRRPLLHP
ncbi:hypothetical protein CEXT_663581, partial [Caerostris extrusa]